VGPVPIFEKVKKCMTDVVGKLRTINLRMLLAPTTIGSVTTQKASLMNQLTNHEQRKKDALICSITYDID